MVFTNALHTSFNCSRVDIGFDSYHKISMKQAEKKARSSTNGILYSELAKSHRIQPWKNVLACSESKTAIVNFLVQHCNDDKYLQKLDGKKLYMAVETFQLSSSCRIDKMCQGMAL